MKHLILALAISAGALHAGRILDGVINIGTSGNAQGYLLGRHGTVGWVMLGMYTTEATATCYELTFSGCDISTRLDATTALIGPNFYEGGRISLSAGQGWQVRFAEIDQTGWTGEFIETEVAFEYNITAQVQKYLGDGRYRTLFPIGISGSGRARLQYFGSTDGLTWSYELVHASLNFNSAPSEAIATPELAD